MPDSSTRKKILLSFIALLAIFSRPVFAADTEIASQLTGHWTALTALAVFIIAYALVISEETIHLRKSKPMMVAAGFIWVLVAMAYQQLGQGELVEEMVRHGLLEFVELFLFLLAAMTYINTMDERSVFDVLRAWLLAQRFSLRALFWVTGGIAFVMSPALVRLATSPLVPTICTVSSAQPLPISWSVLRQQSLTTSRSCSRYLR